ncbi:MAG: 2,3-bisphosphoglycerate-independent phosphoglycerate mutase [Bacteriovoracaceae bacterium]|nr:2,3-bisphosphoglycerate-independent phosphoglycerate mutase [Bacteriovoracaceae bacterium]
MTHSISIKNLSKRVLLVVLDGFGLGEDKNKNAILAAKTPHLHDLFSHYPFTKLISHGESVGLPKGVMGNSEVGHLNLGAGRPVRQDLVRINESIAEDKLKNLPEFKNLTQKAKSGSKRIHLMGLLSDGGVHSHLDHIKYIIHSLSQEKDLDIFFHAFMDGRDTSPTSGISYVKDLLECDGFTLASMQGRSIAMDRDRRWEKIEVTYKTLTGNGSIVHEKPEIYLQNEYQKNITDEFITPALFDQKYAIQNDDCVFFLNFRPDRARQITLAFTDAHFSFFKNMIRPVHYLCMTPYVQDEVNLPILFDKENLKGTLSEFLSQNKISQLKIAETEKYAHVTYFFNGGRREPFPLEKQILINSNKEVATYDEKPEMSAHLITEKLLQELDNQETCFFLVNFANADMVGHTGNYTAAVCAIEVLDECLGQLQKKCAELNMVMMITADHGNSDQMVYEDGSPHTAHTTADVPFSFFHPKLQNITLNPSEKNLSLKDVAPTIVSVMGLEAPPSFQGRPIFL